MEDKSVMTRMQSVGGHDSSCSEDSSYDSDYCCEASEDSSVHCDVSRTVSDTLAQEFSEYVNVKEDTQTGHIDYNYVAKVDFARKLGYSEDQVKIALGKLGKAATQNELLAELIQLDVRETSVRGGCGVSPPTILLQPAEPSKLRHIVIDGSNVAMSHGSNKVFSSHGIKIAVDYFRSRGHKEITVFVPMYRKETCPDDPVSDPKILTDLETDGILVWTPSKKINNRRMVCYDDRYILKLASETDGIVVSNDNYRDLTLESPDFKRVVEERTLMYSFVNDRFMPPEDPLGRNGPTLDQILMSNTTPRTVKQIPCPYGRKCTFGTKCKYYHTTQKVSVSEALRKQAAMKTTSLPILRQDNNIVKLACSRTKSAVINPSSSLHLQLSLQQQQQHLQNLESLNISSSSPHSKSFLASSYSCPGGNSSSPSSSSRSHSSQFLGSNNNPSNNLLSSNNNSSCSGSSSSSSNNSHNPSMVNGHRKLQRQLSVNPSAFMGTGAGFQNMQSNPQHKSHNHLLQLPKESTHQIFYNLAAIFPEDRVRHVMNLYPHETDPQVICRHILEIYK